MSNDEKQQATVIGLAGFIIGMVDDLEQDFGELSSAQRAKATKRLYAFACSVFELQGEWMAKGEWPKNPREELKTAIFQLMKQLGREGVRREIGRGKRPWKRP